MSDLTPEQIDCLTSTFNDAALERLTRANHDYLSSHGQYIAPLASLLLAERVARAAAEKERDKLREDVRRFNASIVEHHASHNLSDAAWSESVGGPCQICARAQQQYEARKAREVLAAAASKEPA